MTILFDAAAHVKSTRPFGQRTPKIMGRVDERTVSTDLFPATTRRGRLGAAEPVYVAERFEPTTEDRAWWAAESSRLESVPLDRHYDDLAAESAALDGHEAGLY